MTEVDVSLSEVDELGVEILAAVERHGGESDSHKVKKSLDGVGTTPFNYRVRRYFEPLGLLDTWQPEGEPGNIPPKKLELTEKGKEFLEDRRDAEPLSIEDQVEQLEQRIGSLEQENQQLREQNRELQSALEQSGAGGVADEIRGLQDSINSLQDRVREIEEHPVMRKDDSVGVLNASLIAGNTASVWLKEEFGEETIEDTQEDVKQTLEENGSLFD